MINEPLYKKTVDILYQAYFNDTLRSGDPCACAVGNLVASNLKYAMVQNKNYFDWVAPSGKIIHEAWSEVHNLGVMESMAAYCGDAKKQIDATGYLPHETCRIERAFENASRLWYGDEAMFKGLVAVLDVLAEIHQVNQEVAAESVHPFQQHYRAKQTA